MTEYTCSICCENFNNLDWIYNTPCNHMFHIECLKNWINTENMNQPNCDMNSCPNCRSPFKDPEETFYTSEEQKVHIRKIIDRIHNDPESQKVINTLLYECRKRKNNPYGFNI